jgi:hypothetical protein
VGPRDLYFAEKIVKFKLEWLNLHRL